jgi:hypothetical protein
MNILCVDQCSKLAGIFRYTIPELPLFLNFIPALIDIYNLHLSFSHFF